jgi:hypothetical protein
MGDAGVADGDGDGGGRGAVTIQRYPLAWPVGWKRTDPHRRAAARFGRKNAYAALQPITVSDATGELLGELERLGASAGPALSTNLILRLDGFPRSDQPAPIDPGAAVYFELDGKTLVLACDKWYRVADNIYAIAKHIDALRGQDRWGVGTVEQAFRGYTALPAGNGADPWWHVLGVNAHAPTEQVKSARNAKILVAHPDHGGSAEAFASVNRAWDQFCKERGIGE